MIIGYDGPMERAILSVITDEVSDSLEEAAAFALAQGLRHVELRTIGGINLMAMEDAEISRVRKALDRLALRVIAFASPLLKWGVSGEPAPGSVRTHGYVADRHAPPSDRYRRAFEICRLLGADRLRVFTFLREPPPAPADLATALAELVTLSRQFGTKICVEHESVCSVGSIGEVDRFLAAHRQPEIHLLLDPGNFAEAGDEPGVVPGPWRERVGHIHVKDFNPARRTFHPVGEGSVDFRSCFESLKAKDGIAIGVSLETHCPQEKIAASTRSLQALRRLLGEIGIAIG